MKTAKNLLTAQLENGRITFKYRETRIGFITMNDLAEALDVHTACLHFEKNLDKDGDIELPIEATVQQATEFINWLDNRLMEIQKFNDKEYAACEEFIQEFNS